MRSTWKTLVAAVATALVAPQLANADDIEEQLRQMQERMDQLEDELAATNDQLEASTTRVEEQQHVIERARLDDESAASWTWSRPGIPRTSCRRG
jgi:TolA-binding protein